MTRRVAVTPPTSRPPTRDDRAPRAPARRPPRATLLAPTLLWGALAATAGAQDFFSVGEFIVNELTPYTQEYGRCDVDFDCPRDFICANAEYMGEIVDGICLPE